jgi:hypothetical protein
MSNNKVNEEVKKLEKLFSWWEFYDQCQQEENKNKTQKQIESQKKKLKSMKDGETKRVSKRK